MPHDCDTEYTSGLTVRHGVRINCSALKNSDRKGCKTFNAYQRVTILTMILFKVNDSQSVINDSDWYGG